MTEAKPIKNNSGILTTKKMYLILFSPHEKLFSFNANMGNSATIKREKTSTKMSNAASQIPPCCIGS